MRFEGGNLKVLRKYVAPYEKGDNDPSVISAENCFYEKGFIKNRPGFRMDTENPIFIGDGEGEVNFSLTDSYVYLDGEYGRVAINTYDNLMGSITFKLKLVTASGETRDLGNIDFVRVDPTHFGFPESYTVFSGNPIYGKGIFFMVRQHYGGDMEDFVKIFEFCDYGWRYLSEEDYYLPTILANGRGEGYYGASLNEKPLEFPDPVKPEGRNLISSRFICYYTTDSSSTSFLLPETLIDNSYIKCEVAQENGNFSWIIPADSENSESVKIGNEDVVALCNRSSGRIYFKRLDGSDYRLDYTGTLNNLKITAGKTINGEAVKVASKTAACKLGGETYGFKSNVTLFYGGRICPSAVFWNSPYNPLYFSENNYLLLGEEKLCVEKIVVRGNEVLAFKENKLFSAPIKKASGKKPITEKGGEKDVDKYELPFLSKCNIDERVIPSTVCVIGSDVLMTTENRKVLKLSSGLGLETVLDLPDLWEKSFALAFRGEYMIVSKNKAAIVKRENAKTGLFLWNFPSELVGGIEYLGKIVLFTSCYHGYTNFVYPTFLDGANDVFLLNDEYGLKTVSSRINSQFVVGLTDLYGKNKLQKIKVDFKAESPALIKISDDNGILCEEQIGAKRGAATLSVLTSSPQINFGFKGNFTFKGFAVEYRKMNKL